MASICPACPIVRLVLLLSLLAGLGLGGIGAPAWLARAAEPAQPSSYALAQRAPFNRPAFYPITVQPDPALYRPNGAWIGRLILPEAATQGSVDWVWIEIEHAPSDWQQLVGERLRLHWQDRPELKGLVRAVSTDLNLSPAARRASAGGDLVPERLDGRRAVGPLQSLAGARPNDDLQVRLEDVAVSREPNGGVLLRIGSPPVQISGRYVALVRLLGPAPPAEAGSPEANDRFLVQHYDRRRRGFEGAIETVRIPQQPPDRYGRTLSSPAGLAASSTGEQGWYLYGAPDARGLFTAQALLPRRLTQADADSSVAGRAAGLRYILNRNWSDVPGRRGQSERVQVSTAGGNQAWRLGQHGLVIHTFGGIGGSRGEAAAGFTVTGHFAFGEVEVMTDPFSGEPRFEIRYHQIYANNPNGIVAGTQDASAYAGDLQRGWIWLRPFSDVLINQPLFAELSLGGRNLSLLRELAVQAELIMARYRSGDGTGLASVTPATSCVQDSSQALFISIRRLRERVQSDPALVRWLKNHPRHPDTLRFNELNGLARSLDQLLTPFGMVRADWKRNAAVAGNPGTGAGGGDPSTTALFQRGQSLADVLLSWRSMLPRRAHDDTARVFLQNGAGLWFLRSNQIPGDDPSLVPLAPTLLLGQLPQLSTLLRRFSDALFTPLGGSGSAASLAVLLTYAGVALEQGRRSGFLPNGWKRRTWRFRPLGPLLRQSAWLLLMPSLSEELVFRVALLPHPLEGSGPGGSLAWGALSVGLFVLYHPLAGASWYPRGRAVFNDPRFLVQCTLLGVACVLTYGLTGSLWAPVLVHWLAVSLWLGPLGGRRQLG
ncbi:CPBP family intramembrane metalloprotease [Synechococcus sp. CS-1324]|uniref:CPBP family glutamic-type intramembrane protease n=1 Tax=unclassified Synechococcus TaxID=2626047 RepID=UPI000DB88CB0|nr:MULTISPECIES: CPBP family glutamic-type intramembrane protease [unclassified Synechococcus]MCT0213988.1 CPBP family intramembrane metalloprotease [Synechococcus sp. CS-1326]MCT0230054.1 CPBP family intramembrane metalloprotease [Synechococcus sp. CS-1324]MCT0233564.1 CPBP family intramembrane metalloprotease [Synechococcus sp. CS-1327]PZV03788.1 MAG: CPBP family intramembrane metalloprotease domain-containing protein [Cyanobium sp.]